MTAKRPEIAVPGNDGSRHAIWRLLTTLTPAVFKTGEDTLGAQ
ncbi:hypothetical protein [Mycobacteroides abscessus]|nr:hypothetical protein [Mycobacteroides abscessus]